MTVDQALDDMRDANELRRLARRILPACDPGLHHPGPCDGCSSCALHRAIDAAWDQKRADLNAALNAEGGLAEW